MIERFPNLYAQIRYQIIKDATAEVLDEMERAQALTDDDKAAIREVVTAPVTP